MEELVRVTFSPHTTSGGASPRVSLREIEKREKQRKETRTVCRGFRHRDAKLPRYTSNASKDHVSLVLRERERERERERD